MIEITDEMVEAVCQEWDKGKFIIDAKARNTIRLTMIAAAPMIIAEYERRRQTELDNIFGCDRGGNTLPSPPATGE